MAKYIVEVKDEETLYKAVIAPDGEPYITPAMGNVYTEPDLEHVREEAYEKGWKEAEDHYEKGYNDGYDTGLSHAWEAARKICAMDSRSRNEVFGAVITATILEHNPAPEAIEKISQYEQEKQFHIGEEIVTQNGFRGVVTGEDGKYVYFINGDGREGCVETMMAAKTGRHFPEFAEALQKMREG